MGTSASNLAPAGMADQGLEARGSGALQHARAGQKYLWLKACQGLIYTGLASAALQASMLCLCQHFNATCRCRPLDQTHSQAVPRHLWEHILVRYTVLSCVLSKASFPAACCIWLTSSVFCR